MAQTDIGKRCLFFPVEKQMYSVTVGGGGAKLCVVMQYLMKHTKIPPVQ